MPVFFWKFILSDIKAMPHKHKSLLNVIKSLVFFSLSLLDTHPHIIIIIIVRSHQIFFLSPAFFFFFTAYCFRIFPTLEVAFKQALIAAVTHWMWETHLRGLFIHCYGTMLRNYEINWILIYSMLIMKCNIVDVIEEVHNVNVSN